VKTEKKCFRQGIGNIEGEGGVTFLVEITAQGERIVKLYEQIGKIPARCTCAKYFPAVAVYIQNDPIAVELKQQYR
jgi:hypothetical protein